MKLDFDATGDKAKDLVRSFFEMSRKANEYKRDEFQRVYEMYKNVQDLTGKDKNRSNLFIPKLYTNVETMAPLYHDAILGTRPYIPIELSNKRDAEAGEAMTRLIDEFLVESNYVWETAKWIKYVILYGLGFIEARPTYYDKQIRVYVPQYIIDMNGRQIPTGGSWQTKTVRRFGLAIRSYAPWDIYQDWAYGADTIDGNRAIIKFRGMVSKRQVKEMAARGDFGSDFDFDRIDASTEELKSDDWARNMATDIGVSLPENDGDLGPWLSYESKGRYIDLWGFNLKVRDVGNQFDHKKINLTRIINTDDPNYVNAWYGIGEGRPIEQLVSALNDNWNQAFDNHNMMGHKVIAYDEEAVSVDQLVMVAGNRIPTTPGLNSTIADAFYEFPVQPMTADFYRIPGVLEGMIDSTMGVHDPLRGESPPGGQTAREAILLRRAGDSRMKIKIRMGEQMGLRDFGGKVASIIDQFAQPDDIIEKIGVEMAMKLPTVDPSKYEGVANYAFKGAARFAEDQIQKQNSIDVYQLMVNNPTINQQNLAEFILRRIGVDSDERKRLINDPQMVALMQLLQQAQQSGGTTRAVSDGRTVGGSGGNNMTGRQMGEFQV